MSKPVQVTIYGQQYTVRSGEDPQRVEKLAALVDGVMRDIANRGIMDTQRAAVLACLHLADRVETLEAQVAAAKATPDKKQKINDLLSLLDEELK